MSNNINFPTIKTLPMEDIAAYLSLKKNFIEGKKLAHDVKYVDEIPSDKIAISVDNDRHTVLNSEKLGGLPASDYLTSENGKRIEDIADNIANIYTNSLLDLQNEYYSTISELDKIGIINVPTTQLGFFDNFKRTDVKFDITKSNVVEKNKKFDLKEGANLIYLYLDNSSLIKLFDKGQFFVVLNKRTKDYRIVKSFGISIDNAVVINCAEENIEIFLEDVEAKDILIQKTLGNYIDHTFSFSEYKNNIFNSNIERYTTQNDDTYTISKRVENNYSGYSTIFKIPKNTKGALTKFEVRGRCSGEPGALICHVLKKEAAIDYNGNFNPSFTDIENARLRKLVVASSKPLYPKIEYSTTSDLVFNFKGTTNEEYPILKDEQYLFIIECLDYSNNNYWEFDFSYYNSPSGIEDVQKNNLSYVFKKNLDTLNNEKPLQEIANYDLIFSLATIKVIDKDEFGYNEGLYTAPITLYNETASRIRAEVAVNKEGLYTAELKNFDSAPSNKRVITLNQYSQTSYSPFNNKFKKGDKIVVANQICEVEEVNGATIILKDNLKIDETIKKLYSRKYYDENQNTIIEQLKLPAYRLNFDLYIKSNYINFNEWDENLNVYKFKNLTNNLKMNFVKIIPTNFDDYTSSILVYEIDLYNAESNEILYANDFELQIKWTSPYSVEEINNFKNSNKKELIGKIKKLTLSLSKKC